LPFSSEIGLPENRLLWHKRMKSEENRENCITRKFTICNLHQALLNLRVINSRKMRYKGHVAHDLRRRIKCLQVV